MQALVKTLLQRLAAVELSVTQARSINGVAFSSVVDNVFSFAQFTLLALVVLTVIAVAVSIARTLLRAAGLDLVVGFRRLDQINDYPDDWDRRRYAVLSRDAHRCRNCGQTGRPLHVHHVVPLSSGGSNRMTNLHTLCDRCHARLHPHMR